MFKINNNDTRTKSIAWRCTGVFIVNFEHIAHLVLLFLLLTLRRYISAAKADTEWVNMNYF